jgi:hypothetical protein
MGHLPVVPDDGDGRAAQSDIDEDTSEIEADEGGDGRGGRTAGGDNTSAALRRSRRGDWGRGRAVGHGGSKGLDEGQFGENISRIRCVQ